MTVSPHDPAVTTPQAHTELLGTKLCDADWFASQFDAGRREREPGLWTVELTYCDVGWFGVDQLPVVGA